MNLTLKEKVSYGIGAFGKDIAYMLTASYLMYYYNTVLGMDSVFIGFVLMAARIFDAFNDPIMGVIIAKTKSPWGKFRPWIIAGTVLNAIFLYALFAVPENTSNMNLYLIVCYLLWGLTYTLMDIPYWSLIPAISDAGESRERVAVISRASAGVGDMLPSLLTMAVVPLLGGGAALTDMRIGFKYWALIIGIVFIISEIVCVSNVKEKINIHSKSYSVKEMLKSLRANDQAIACVITLTIINASLYFTSNLVIYYFQYDLKNLSAYTVFSGVGGISQFLGMILYPAIRKRYYKKMMFDRAIFCQFIGYGVLLLFALSPVVYKSIGFIPGWFLLFIPGFFIFFGTGLLNVLLTVFLADSIDFGEWKSGRRDESVVFSMQTFVVKLASGIAILLTGISIRLVGLDTKAGAPEATHTSLLILRLLMIILPCIGLYFGLQYFRDHYKLAEAKLIEINTFLSAQRASQQD